jgi:hypothetical protein
LFPFIQEFDINDFNPILSDIHNSIHISLKSCLQKQNTKHTTATQQTKSVKWNDNKGDDFVNMVHNQHNELTSIIGDLENIQLNNEGSQQDVHTSSIVIDRYSNFGNTYLSKEIARILGPGQIVTSLEHLTQCRDVQVTSLCGLGLTHVRLF